MFWFFGCKSWGILAPQSGIEPTPPALEDEVVITGPPGRCMEWPHILKLNRESLLLLIKDCDYCIGPFMYKVQSWSLLEEVGRMVTLEGWIVPKGDVSGLWKASHVLCIDLEAGKCVCSVCEKIVKTPLTVWALFSLYWLPQKCFLKWDQFICADGKRSPRYTGYKRTMSLLLQTNVYIHNYAYSHTFMNKSNTYVNVWWRWWFSC